MNRRRLIIFLLAGLAAAPAQAQDRPRDWEPPPIERIPNFREVYRNTIIELASYAKKRNPKFVVLVRGGVELPVKGEIEAEWEQARDPAGRDFDKRLPVGTQIRPYLKLLDGMVFDNLYCGPFKFEKPLAQAIADRQKLDAELAEERRRGVRRPPVPLPTGPFSLDPAVERQKFEEIRIMQEREERQRRLVYALAAMRDFGGTILSIENCATKADADGALAHGDRDKVLVFAGQDNAKLNRMPPGHLRYENPKPVVSIPDARNWLPMLKGDRFGSRAEWVMALSDTNYDAILVDVSFRGLDALTPADVFGMRFKKLGAPRLVLADMPLGRAADWRWYWLKGWQAGNPNMLVAPDPNQPGVFITDLTDRKWKEILSKYLVGVMDMGFDGVVFDDLDTFRWFEDLMPVGG